MLDMDLVLSLKLLDIVRGLPIHKRMLRSVAQAGLRLM